MVTPKFKDELGGDPIEVCLTKTQILLNHGWTKTEAIGKGSLPIRSEGTES